MSKYYTHLTEFFSIQIPLCCCVKAAPGGDEYVHGGTCFISLGGE